jgi:hypothetical protein
MPWNDTATGSLVLLCVALAATVLAMLLLALQYLASRRIAERAPGVLAAALAIAAALTCWNRALVSISLVCGGLAIVLLIVWPLSLETVRQRLGRLLTPKLVWSVVLGVGLIASRYLAAHALSALPQITQPAIDLQDVPVFTAQALTDAGRSVALFHFKMHSTDSEVEQFLRSTESRQTQIIRLTEPNPASNCHGWIFTGGRYGVRDGEVQSILSDNGYREVVEPEPGDLAVYINADKITHCGLVRMADKHAPVLIESKWGPFGVYLHAADQQPFSGVCKFYRSPRANHLLALRRNQPASSQAAATPPQSTMLSQR